MRRDICDELWTLHLPLTSSSSIVVLESVDSFSFTCDPSLFFVIMLLPVPDDKTRRKEIWMRFCDKKKNEQRKHKLIVLNKFQWWWLSFFGHISTMKEGQTYLRSFSWPTSLSKLRPKCKMRRITLAFRTSFIIHPVDSIFVTLSLRLALNFFKQSTVSCLCTTDATRSRCWKRKMRIN